MNSIWARLDSTKKVVVCSIAGAILAACAGLLAVGRSTDLRSDAVGLWACNVVDTDTARPDDNPYIVEAVVPPPFDALPDEMKDRGLYVLPYRAPQSTYVVAAANPQIAIYDDGLIMVSGLSYEGESIHSGRLTREGELYVARFDTALPDHAFLVEEDVTTADVLSWEGRNTPPNLFGVNVVRHDAGIDLRFSTGVTGYEARCIKQSDSPTAFTS